MNIIKGLIIKDLLQLKSYAKTLIVFIIVFSLVSIEQDSSKIDGMLIMMMTLCFGMFSIATFSYDEMTKADRYILSFPVTKKDIILSKYVLVIFLTVIGSIIGMILSIIISLIMNSQIPNITDYVSLLLGGILGIGIIECIKIPLIYKFGVEKGRIQMVIIIALIAFLLGGAFWIFEKLNVNLSINNMFNVIESFLPAILVIGIIVLYYVSYRISYKIYLKKEL